MSREWVAQTSKFMGALCSNAHRTMKINLTAAASPDCITTGREAVACLVWGTARRMDVVPILQAFSEKKRRAWPYPALAPLEKPSSLLSDRENIE